ncbi:hypothetical protein pEaSNUABM56_00076 [Erwinia phage pEa_SNUABM_56]|uniref:Uncharacterized protein n=1 Tax=Erwinia phage pEp_SNUABM_01 TaxID=2601643 RepID=A0A5J6DBK9_9CAUD|nr:hypothetical protein HWC63_gp049 [Erwinia phage pEp_SNUABM_01]QEQ94875.1 hypothetical protein pEpSNUABM01_049 [Erwinia phage pEp_SNUABM_01]UYL84806.1 hypothetical protein pEaSNUABM55_00008 [Erwinia phage pEa_SNUABM_55]UYL85121.1 hypothetical protein pEaSNUABM56_00076 [Erwinia phage pEa_SNUABM_56]
MAITTAPELFELATRQKLRFESPRGLLTVEDLWDLPMTGAVSLDIVSKLANRDVKASEEESFVTASTAQSTKALLKLEVLKYIIAVRKDEIAQRQLVAQKAERKQKLLSLLAEQDEAADKKLSRDEILKELADL